MPGRSLQLSASGQQQARQALVYKNLTQRAIANDLAIASWATVNKFFNGKPVDRFLFQELCIALDLDWSAVAVQDKSGVSASTPEASAPGPEPSLDGAIASPSPSPSPSSASPLLTAVRTQATAAREALTPRILQRISRPVIRQTYLEAIEQGVHQGKPRVIALIGPAGYGKSTILGDLYDELVQRDTPWVGLVLCSSLSFSPGYRGFISYGLVAATLAPVTAMGSVLTPSPNQQALVEVALGQNLCGEDRSVVAIAAQLNQTYGRGVLLIDTLDLVINRDMVIVLGNVLRPLLAQGTTVAVTCRDHEYHDYLEPINQRLPGLTQHVDRYIIPNFTTDEIRTAAQAFFHALTPDHPERGRTFADNILALSTDNRSLREILENPLLLALLCDLFASDGTVPADLTVSKLYRRYWQEKIAYSRIHQSHFAPLAIEKETLCLHIAQRLFELSQTRLYESFYRDELGIPFTQEVIAACNDLLSEGVLSQLASGKLHFFHQTLLEYAIAYWLTRQSADAARAQLLQLLRQVELLRERTHWLPVLRQFLAIVDDAEFEQIVPQLDMQHMGVFGAIANATVSRDRPDALRQLLPIALQLGEPHQRRLRQALASAPRPLIETTWDVFMTLLTDAEHATAGNTVHLVGTLLERWWHALHPKLDETLRAIAIRPTTAHPTHHQGYDDRKQLYGWLLQPCLPHIQAFPTPEGLRALQHYMHLFGHGTVAGVIQSHRNAPLATQQDLLQRLLQAPVPRYSDVKEALIELVFAFIPQRHQIKAFPLGDSILDILHYTGPEHWDAVQISAVGRWAAQDQEIFYTLLQDYLYGTVDRMRRNLNALLESLDCGSGIWLLPYLHQLQHDQDAIAQLSFTRLSKLFPHRVIENLSADTQESLAQWLQPFLPIQINTLYTVINGLADASPTARHALQHYMEMLPGNVRQQMRGQLLRFQPIEAHPPIHQLSKGDQRYLIAIYQRQARDSPVALAKLLEIALGTGNDAAVTASQNLATISGETLEPTRLLPLLRSPFVGVRVNGLEAVVTLSRTTPLTPPVMEQLCQILTDEPGQTVVRYFYNLVADWVRQQRQVLPVILLTMATLLTRMIATGQLEGGVGRSLVAALKAIVRTEEPTLDRELLSQTVHQLLTSLHFIQIKNGESEVIDVLCGIHRLNPAFLKNTIDRDWPVLLQRGWMRNISTLIKSFRKLEGAHSPLLETVMQRYGDRPEIESLILESRGA